MTLRLRITARASAEVFRADKWWRENRPSAPNAVRDDLRAALDLLLMQPAIGQKVENARLADVRRLHIDRIRYHVYVRVKGDELVVLSMWHSSRGRQPRV